jgi:hypothetical protein
VGSAAQFRNPQFHPDVTLQQSNRLKTLDEKRKAKKGPPPSSLANYSHSATPELLQLLNSLFSYAAKIRLCSGIAS